MVLCIHTCMYIDGLVQDCSISTAYALEILQSCIKPSICAYSDINNKYHEWVIPWYLVPLFVFVKRVRPTCPPNVTFTILYLLYIIRQFAEWEPYLYGRKGAGLNVWIFILHLYTMLLIIIKIHTRKLWMWQLWMWRGRTLDEHTSHSQKSNISIVMTSTINITLRM